MTLLAPMFRMMSSSGDRGRLSVLIFHRVLPEPDPLFPEDMHARRFDELCGWLRSWFKILALDEAVKHLKAGTLPAGSASITFDDGYADNHRVALPILQRHGLSATFFIATGFLDGGRMWNDTVIESVRQSKFSGVDLSALGLGDHSIESLDQKRAAIASLIGQIKYLGVEERIAVTEALAQVAKVRPPENLMMTSHEVKAMRLAGMQKVALSPCRCKIGNATRWLSA